MTMLSLQRSKHNWLYCSANASTAAAAAADATAACQLAELSYSNRMSDWIFVMK